MRNTVIFCLLACGIGIGYFWLEKSSQAESKTPNEDVNVSGSYSSGLQSMSITKSLDSSDSYPYYLSFVTANSGGCTGFITAVGQLRNSVLEAKSIRPNYEDKERCKLHLKILAGGERIKVEQENCSSFSGMACGFSGEYTRDKPSHFFSDLFLSIIDNEDKKPPFVHAFEIIEFPSIREKLMILLKSDFNDLYDRVQSSEPGYFALYGNRFCGEGIKPHEGFSERAIVCADFDDGTVQAAVMKSNQIKVYANGRVFDEIATWQKKEEKKF